MTVRPNRRWVGAGLVVLAAAIGGAALAPTGRAGQPGQPGAAQAAEDLSQARALSRAFQRAAGRIEPSVVHITSRVTLRGRDFRGRLLQRESEGVGSGVIVTSDGYILTNNHVVAEADQVIVRVNDGRQLDGTVIGVDPGTDLAVVKVEASNLAAAEFGNSDALEVGEWVLAVGSPFGTFDNTVTAGIVSAMNRTGLAGEGEKFEEYIQTDAAINPGNSGGPLVNLEGDIIGINSQIATRGGGSVGIGFAIPSSIARAVMDMLIKDGRVVRGWLGVSPRDLTPEEAAAAGISTSVMGVPNGVMVHEVVPGGPAAAAGLKAGDVILRFNGRAMTGSNRFRNSIAFTPPGARATVEVLRAGRTLELTAQLSDMTSGRRLALGAVEVPRLGIAVATLPAGRAEQLARAARLRQPLRGGIFIAELDDGGLASQSGLEAGDVIVSVNNAEVTDAAEFARLAARLDLRRPNRFDVIGERDGALVTGNVEIGGR